MTGGDGIPARPGRPGHASQGLATPFNRDPGPVVLAPHIAVAAVGSRHRQAATPAEHLEYGCPSQAGWTLVIVRVQELPVRPIDWSVIVIGVTTVQPDGLRLDDWPQRGGQRRGRRYAEHSDAQQRNCDQTCKHLLLHFDTSQVFRCRQFISPLYQFGRSTCCHYAIIFRGGFQYPPRPAGCLPPDRPSMLDDTDIVCSRTQAIWVPGG